MTALTMDEPGDQGSMPPDELSKPETKVPKPSDDTNPEKSNPVLNQPESADSAKSAKSPEDWEESAKSNEVTEITDANHKDDENESGKAFSGEILYNPDGSAYILEERELINQVPRQEGSFIQSSGSNLSQVDYPRIEQAVYIAKRQAWYSAMGSAYLRMLKEKVGAPEVHSFKVFSIQEQLIRRTNSSEGEKEDEGRTNERPILMCFPCKLSFTLSRPFLNHCEQEHSVNLTQEEKDMFKRSSGILQSVGLDKSPLLSVLEPQREVNEPYPPLIDLEKTVDEDIDEKPVLVPYLSNLLETLKMNGPGGNSADPSFLAMMSGLNPNLPPTNASQLQGTTIGPCPDHVTGRQPGVECEKCDFILNSFRLGDPSWTQQRGIFKTLKCPKCNWHYKYQETLEVHMKEKHPDAENSCIYCITGQQHPRLARGETYTCGYKPYRCEVCNYSTTTKGNLSIHMQSDKHINNMQELQNGGVITAPDGTKITQAALAQMPMGQRLNANHTFQPQNWRCDLCNYETNIPRNLRIHLTSDKHVQNMACMSENMKQIQNFQFLQTLAGGKPEFPPHLPPNPLSDMMMEMSQNPALLFQFLKNSQPLPLMEGVEPHEPPPEPVDPNPSFLFNCCICRQFSTNSIESLSCHVNLDRYSEPDTEISILLGGVHLCKLCSYKTNLKANFQLHLKTDKHLARLSLLNHIREGGSGNEWKLKYLLGTNPVQLRCNCCDFYTNSLHKLQVHIQTQAHEVSLILFHHLVSSEQQLEQDATFSCSLCTFSTRSKSLLLQHSRTLSHLRAEQIGELRRLSGGEDGGEQPDVADIFTVTPADNKDSELRDRTESKDGEFKDRITDVEVLCPICQEKVGDFNDLVSHAMQAHQLGRSELHRLLILAEGGSILNKFRLDPSMRTPPKDPESSRMEQDQDTEPIENLGSPIGAISEKHVYKYRCNQCSLAFKTQEKLEFHSRYHQIRDTTKCKLCDRSFRSVGSLLKHVESGHLDGNQEDIEQYSQQIRATLLLVPQQALEITHDKEEDEEDKISRDISDVKKKIEKTSYSVEKFMDPRRPFKCDVCKESFTQKNILLVHFNSVSHLHKMKKFLKENQENPNNLTPQSEGGSPSSPLAPGSTLMSVLGSLNAKKQLEPDNELKPYKCNICQVSYAQGSTLDIHIRSVLHHTRANKLQELVMTGHVDLSKPLIENPDNADEANNSEIELFSPKSLSSNNSIQRTPNPDRDISSYGPLSSTPKSLSQMFEKVSNESTKEDSINGQDSSINHFENSESPSSNSDTQSFNSLPDDKKSSIMLKSLLQNYGFELVMQFNESHQKIKLEKERLRIEQEKEEFKRKESPEENKVDERFQQPKESECPMCSEKFSSIKDLKAHSEEKHDVVIAQEFEEEIKSNSENQEKDESSKISPDEVILVEKDALNDVSSITDEHEKSNNKPDVDEKDNDELNPFQQAFKAFKEHEAKLLNNPNLQNMNLHPPLIPGILPKLPGNQLNNQNHTSPFENQIFSKLGINPDVVRQAGLDPKLLIHLALIDPKSAMDPRMLSMFDTQAKETEFPNKKMMQLALESKLGMMPNLPQGFPGAAELLRMNQQHYDAVSRRARTRITDDQLKVLRANFDINNSPSEEQINNLSLKTYLPPKVIKHWFRNTLFKERQRNKDSPYNFNNPPSTMLNLEEYEKTGESKVISLNSEEQRQYADENTKYRENEEKNNSQETESEKSDQEDSGHFEIKKENEFMRDEEMNKIDEFRKLQMSLALRVSVSPDNGNPNGKSFDGIFSPQMNTGDRHPLLQSPLPPGFPNPLGFLPVPGHLGPNFFNGFGGFRNPSPLSDPHGYNHSAAAKRANRTRFTDYQIKVLQEFFENNAYPKDDDLEYLSKLLGLSPRVIVVWFQNARQKARKIYENQPAVESEEDGAGRFTRTPGLNYQCKKCLLVFQRYYELIRHQKQHCFKEEDAKRSALAQRAAATAAAQFVGQANVSLGSMSVRSDSENESILREQNVVSPISSIEGQSGYENSPRNSAAMSPIQKLIEDSKNIGTIFEKRNQEDRVMKYLNEAQINLMTRYPANSHLAFLQKQGLSDIEDQSNDSFVNMGMKRKLSEENDEIERDENGQPKDKRLRTTILPEQLDYLYQKYQIESNPSRKMLEQIAAEVGLRKRVVQVWFQNTRARERKGQFRAHQQVINKRCPFCPALFKVRSALESHLVTKHSSQYTRGEINIDALPDAGVEEPQLNMLGRSTLFPSVPCPSSPPQLPPLIPNQDKSSEFEASMRKYYEETMKQFISDVKLSQQNSSVQESRIYEKNSEALDLSSPPLRQEDTGEENKNLASDRDSQSSPVSGIDSQIYEYEDENGMTLSSNYSFDSQNYDSRKKFRTQISHTQVKMMKCVFEECKMPTMTECHLLADFIGLQKRVVQVWFQNARAKEKKIKLHLNLGAGSEESESTEVKDSVCKFCKCQYENKYKVQEHLFDRNHLENVRKALEEGKYEPENPGGSTNLSEKLSKPNPDLGSNKPFNYEETQPHRPEENIVNSANQEKQSNHFVNDQSVYNNPQQQQPQQHYRTDQQNFNFPQQPKYYPEHHNFRPTPPYPQHQEYNQGYCQNQIGYPGSGYPPYTPGYGAGYNPGYNGYPYQPGVQN